ncbi:MAG: hypothetical protein C0408_04065 [Odoribacter sp.]|nr:hypothetical protein [Odoribacter sp.]
MLYMKRTILFLLTLLISYTSFSQSGPGAILPTDLEVPGWRTSGELKVYNREDLSDLMNDEAKLIMEFGFRNIVSRDYFNFSGKVINIQVYTMENTFGSCGIFLLKSRDEKVFKEFGNACFENAGNFTFWKQYYLVRMHSVSTGDSISAGFKLMAGVIDSKIKSRSIFPDILGLSNDKPGNITIFKGPLALANIYYFSPLNIFKMNEGIAIENGDNTEIILKYTDNDEAVRRFSDTAGILSGMEKFSGFLMVGDYSFALKDVKGKTLIFRVDDNYINISIK